MNLVDRFEAKVARDPETGCWNWSGATSAKGYGRFGVRGRNRLAYRVAYEIHVGPIPEGLVLDHLCRNRACVNPAHLEPVTPLENTRRGVNWNTEKTKCAHGHPFDEANTFVRPDGSRCCRECSRARSRAHSESQRRERGAPLAPHLRTHCPHGHAYDDTNTYWYDGRRQCKACRAARDQDRRAAPSIR